MLSLFLLVGGDMALSLFYEVLNLAREEKGKKDQTIKDLIALTKNMLLRDREKGLKYGKHIKNLINDLLKNNRLDKQFLYNSYFTVLVVESPYSLDSYFQALEWNRPIEEQFYLPRRKQLMEVVDNLEKLLITDELDELFLSMPSRVGKTTLVMFAMSWQLGVKPERANLYSSCSGTLTNAFFKGLMEILNDDKTYAWHTIFPNVLYDRNSFVNSKECYLDVGRIKRYHSFTGRSIDAESLNGACDCNGILVGDDLCSGIEEALNKERLYMLSLKVRNNLIPRAKMGAKKLWIGTRWSLLDPIQVRLNSLEETSVRYKVINRPALDPVTDESNFDYLFNVGFNTEYYRNIRTTFERTGDKASWLAQYCGQPIERSGLLFPDDELGTFQNLPDTLPDRIFGFTDVAWGGGDYTVLPILAQYGEVLYCVAFVCDNGDKTITQPKVVEKIIRYKAQDIEFEKNNGGENYKEAVEKRLFTKGYFCNISLKRAYSIQQKGANSKLTHINERAPEIRQILFLDKKLRDNDYNRAMDFLTSFTISTKNKYDDVPDALSKTIDMKELKQMHTSISVCQRLF